MLKGEVVAEVCEIRFKVPLKILPEQVSLIVFKNEGLPNGSMQYYVSKCLADIKGSHV